jgi:hypothetical protein
VYDMPSHLILGLELLDEAVVLLRPADDVL